jgi:hypothetical protein
MYKVLSFPHQKGKSQRQEPHVPNQNSKAKTPKAKNKQQTANSRKQKPKVKPPKNLMSSFRGLL